MEPKEIYPETRAGQAGSTITLKKIINCKTVYWDLKGFVCLLKTSAVLLF